MKTRTVLLLATCLFAVDQAIKIVIDRYFLDVNFDILPPLFYFKPTFNAKYSWINGLFDMGMGFWTHMILFCMVAIIVVLLYDFMKMASGNAKLLNIAFIFGFAGLMSGIIGTICWNGCLDYIYLKPLFVFDLKDLYIDTYVILLLIYGLKHTKHHSAFKTKDTINHFKNRLKQLKIYISSKNENQNGS